MPRRMYVRRFLNRSGHHGAAYVLCEVEDTSRRTDERPYPEVTFQVADCYRHIELDFPLDSRAQRRNSLYKAAVLRDAVSRFADALAAEAELMERRDREAAGRPRTGLAPEEDDPGPE